MKAFYFIIATMASALFGTVSSFAQRVEIVSAYYGVGNYRVEVTEQVQRLAANRDSFEVSSRNLGLPSLPIPGKQLTVVYTVGHRQYRESAQEGETFRFKTADVSERNSDRNEYHDARDRDRGEGREVRVVRAEYGSSGNYTDVTDEVRRRIQTGEDFRVSPDTFGMDSDQRGGRLRITVIDRHGERIQRVFEDGDRVDLR
ncbi:MAG: hypothetical protein JOY96_12625 [Verrucomicrobia bacterium]|nr:hypothetical protein [Verrucomicrobiota bacterium]